jgi:hypothetical protein
VVEFGILGLVSPHLVVALQNISSRLPSSFLVVLSLCFLKYKGTNPEDSVKGTFKCVLQSSVKSRFWKCPRPSLLNPDFMLPL